MEKTIQTKKCKHCTSSFDITDKDLEFYDKVSPKFDGVKYNIPTPTLCPDCRQQSRLAFRNENKLYKRKCDASGEDIISLHSPDKPYKVYTTSFWKSDNFDPREYGKNFDFNRGFFDQIKELLGIVPMQGMYQSSSNNNSDYVNFCSGMNNCYLIFDSMDSGDCFYGTKVSFCNDCADCDYTIKSENCYSCNDCSNSYKLFYSSYSKDCKDSYFIFDCIGCSDCFMCKGLKNKRFYIKNVKYSEEDYKNKIKEFLKKDINEIQIDYEDFLKTVPSRFSFINNSENSYGNNLDNTKNCKNCFDSFEIQDCKNCFRIHTSSDCQDYESWGHKSSLIYNVVGTGSNSSNILFSVSSMSKTKNVMYSIFASGCSNCFGCVNLNDNEYCILNKQYTKEEYNKLVPKIIEHMQKRGEWGEFFPSSLSPFGYNETVAQEYFPLEKEEAIKKGFNWSEYEPPKPNVEKVIPADKLPEDISDIPDDILNWAIKCEITDKPYRIIKPELEFYRKHNLPIPRRHPDQRHLDRMKLRNPRKLWDRKCDKCGEEIKTTYSPDREEVVYCEKCYEKELY